MNHYTAVRRRPGGPEEEYEEYEETETNTNVANPEKTEDQLRDMLHSRLYQDGQWRNVKKNTGPRDLSDKSLEQLLKINPGGKSVSQPTNSRKVIKKPKMGNGVIREEHEGDESGNHGTRRGMPRRSQETDDLGRDPFEGNGGTYYDEKHIVREGDDGEKVILIPFEESGNMLDGISEVKAMTGRGKSTQNLPPPQRQSTNVIIPQQVQVQQQESPTRPKKKKKKKDTLNNLLADLDQFDTNGNRLQPLESPSKGQPYMNIDNNGQKQSPKDPQMMRQPTIPGSQKQSPKDPNLIRKPTIPGSQKQSPQSQGNQNPRVYPSPNNPNQQMMQPPQGQSLNDMSGPGPYGQRQQPQNQMNNNQPPAPQQMQKSKSSFCNIF